MKQKERGSSSQKRPKYDPHSFYGKLRKRRIIETLAAFIGGGWLILEFVHWILIDHYHFPEKSLDITFITLICALICTLIWRWFGGMEEPRSIKLEFLVIPVVILITAFLDVRLIQQINEPRAEAAVREVNWKNSIAVMPFANISGEEEQEYFCDGLTEEIINRLTNIKELKVPARTSAFAFKGKEIDIRDIGEKLNVNKILEGSVRKAGDRIRVTAQLINIADGFHLWSKTYNCKLEDVFDVQDDISLMIANELKIKLLGKERARLTKRQTENIEAYELGLKGFYFLNKRTEKGIRKALNCFQQAIKEDPGYALAYVGIAGSYTLLAGYELLPPILGYKKSKTAILEALEIDNLLALAHCLLATVTWENDRNLESAEKSYKKAIELNNGLAISHKQYAEFLSALGRHEEAISEISLAQELDPLSLVMKMSAARTFYMARMYDQSIEQCQKLLEMDPSFIPGCYILGLNYLQKRKYEDAVAELQKTLILSSKSPMYLSSLGHAYAVAEKREEALKALDELNEIARQQYVSSFSYALIYTGLDEENQALDYLERANDERYWLVLYIKEDSRFDNLHSHPKFKALVKKIGLDKY